MIKAYVQYTGWHYWLRKLFHQTTTYEVIPVAMRHDGTILLPRIEKGARVTILYEVTQE